MTLKEYFDNAKEYGFWLPQTVRGRSIPLSMRVPHVINEQGFLHYG